MGGHGCVAYKRRLFAGIEETHSNIVFRVFAANTNATSACENSCATARSVASLWPSASSTTVAGLPVKRMLVNASTWKIRKVVSAPSGSFARIPASGYTCVYLGVV